MTKRRKLFQFVREKDTEIGKWKMQNLKILFNKDGNPKTAKLIQEKLSVFSESYCKVTKKIIELSLNLNEESFRENIATLMPSFGMTRRGVFHGINSKSCA